MALTFTELVTQVKEDTGRTDKGTEIGTYINRGQHIIQRDASVMHHDFTCLMMESYRDTVAETKTYSIPSNLKSFYGLRLCESATKRKFHPLTPRTQNLRRPYPEDDSEGTPVYYIIRGRFFDLSPIPDAAYTMHMNWYKWADTISGTTESDLLYMDEVIIKCADWLTVLSLNLEEDIRRFKADYRDLLTSTITADRDANKYDLQLKAQPFTTAVTPGADMTDYHLKPGWVRGPR